MKNKQQKLSTRKEGGKPYFFKGHRIGMPSWDWHTFKLFRKTSQIPRNYPHCLGISTPILMDFIKHGCKVIIVFMNGVPTYRIDPRKWLEKGIIDSLKKGQEPHAFFPLSKFDVIGE